VSPQKKTTTKVAKSLHPLTPLRRNYPVGRREQPSKRGYYAAEERSRREVAEWMDRHGPPPIDWSNPDPERQKELRELARLLSAPLRHDDGTEWTADDHFRSRLRTHLDEPESSLLPAAQAADSEPIWHGHGYKLDDGSFEFPPDMTSRQYFNLHARLHAERDWPHRHRRLHRNEEEILAKELRIPLAQLHAANAKGGMFDLTRLPSDEKERREKVLGLASHGYYVYTVNAGRLRTLHQVPTEDDLLALPAGLASELWCGWLPYYLEHHPDAFLPATLEGHNATIQQLFDHPEQRNASMRATSSTSGACTVIPGIKRSRTRQRPTTAPGTCVSAGTALTCISSGPLSSEARATRWPMHRVRVHLLQGDPRLNLSIAGNEPDRLSLSGYLV
jgi:hypothetical protein